MGQTQPFSHLLGASWDLLFQEGNTDVVLVNMASSSSFAPPKLCDFILTERLGSGTYASVYKAYRKVAVSPFPWRQQNSRCTFAVRLKVRSECCWCTVTGRQQRGGSSEGGGQEEPEQGVNREPADGDRDPQVCAAPSHRPAQGLPGKDTTSGLIICDLCVSVDASPGPELCSCGSGTLRTFI